MQRYGFLGCDVSKGYCDFVLLDDSGTQLELGFKLDDNREGHKQLEKNLTRFNLAYGFDKTIVGVESTGGYENNWYNGLRRGSSELKLEVFRINPKRIYHSGKSDGVSTTNDQVSAKSIASYLRKNYGQLDLTLKRLNSTNDDTKGARRFHKYIQMLIKQQTQVMNTLEKSLYSLAPELLALKGEKYPTWFLELLIRYPSKNMILDAGLEGLTSIKYISNGKAKKIIDALEVSVGCQEDYWDIILLKDQALKIKSLSTKITKLKKEHVAQVQEVKGKEVNIMTSIKGVGEDSAAALIMEIGEVKNYETAKNLVAHFGIHPTYKKSGDSTYRIGMSKAGSKSARAILYMLAKNVVLHEPYFKSIYHKHAKKGKKYDDIIGIIMGKLLRILYGMLKNEQCFDAGIDALNQQKEQHNPNKMPTENTLTTELISQMNDMPSPISRREKKKRKQAHLAPS